MRFLVPLFFFCYAAIGGWVTNSSIPSLVTVTPNIKTENMSAYLRAFYTLSDGEPHALLGFDGVYAQIWDVNLSNSVSRVLSLTNTIAPNGGNQSEIQCIVTLSNTVLLSTTDSYTNEMWEYVPATGIASRAFTNTASHVVSICRDPDGVIFMGTYGKPRVDEWNPSNRVFRTWGYADDSMTGVGDYAYYINASRGYIYTTIRDGLEWWLSIIDRATSNKTFHWKGEASEMTGYDGIDGKVYLSVHTNGGSTSYWLLTNGTPVSITSGAFSSAGKYNAYDEEPGLTRDFDNWNTETGWEFDIETAAFSVDNSSPACSMRWKKTNDVSWSSITETNNWMPSAAGVNILQPYTGDSLLWLTANYGPIGTFTPGGSASVIGAYKAQDSIDVLQVSATEVYVSGYHLNTFRWNPASNWTRTPSTQDLTDDSYNPYTITELGGKHHCDIVRGSNGKIFIATHYSRNGDGGSINWYDPSDGSTSLERNTFLYSTNTPSDLKPAEGASKLVWCSWGGQIYVWDVASFTQITNFNLTGTSPMHKCVEYESGKMLGVSGTNTYGFTTSGALLWSNNLPANPFSDTSFTIHHKRLTLGPDGYVWMPVGTALYRINPKDGSWVNYKTITSGPNKVMFDGGDAFLYGSSAVYKLDNLLLNNDTLNIGTLRVQNLILR